MTTNNITRMLGRAASATTRSMLSSPASTRSAQQAQTQSPKQEKDPGTQDIVNQLIRARKRVPIYLLSSGLEPGVIPADTEAEVGRSVVSHLLAEGEMSPAGAISGSMEGVGDLELSCPAGKKEIIIPAIVLEFATTTNDSQPGPITASLVGNYSGAPKFAMNVDHLELRPRGAAYENYDFASGVFQVTPRALGQKHTMVILPYEVVNSRTYLRTLAISEALVRFVEAATLRLNVAGAPAGLLTTMSVLTTQHSMYRDVVDAISAD